MWISFSIWTDLDNVTVLLDDSKDPDSFVAFDNIPFLKLSDPMYYTCQGGTKVNSYLRSFLVYQIYGHGLNLWINSQAYNLGCAILYIL